MIQATAGDSFVAFTSPIATGLVGTIGVQIIDGITVVDARHTSDIVEIPAGSGIYAATLTAPDDGRYLVVFNFTDDDWASEDLLVGDGHAPNPSLDTDSPRVPSGGSLALIHGDDYLADDDRAVVFTDANAIWLDLTDAEVKLILGGPTPGITTEVDGTIATVGDTQQVIVELTADNTTALELGAGVYTLQAVLDDSVISIARGRVRVYPTP
jgi:hypothetical protein